MNEIKGIVSGNEVDISKVAMIVDGVDKGWEVRRQNGDILWGADRTLIGTDTIQMKGYGLPLKSVHIKGNTQQTGTPSPQSIIMPEFCGVRTGNLFDPESTRYHMGKASNNQIGRVANGAMFYIRADADMTYTIKIHTSDSTFVRLYLSDAPIVEGIVETYSVISESETAENPEVAITNTNHAYLWIQVGGTWYTEHGGTSIMLNTGTTAIPHEPYGYKIPITCAGQTTPVYLGQVQTVRKIRKLVLTGEEDWVYRAGEPSNVYFIGLQGVECINNNALCTHYPNQDSGSFNTMEDKRVITCFASDGTRTYIGIRDSTFVYLDNFKSYLAQQYAAGTPVTVWYVLAEPETGIVNEPLAKIGDYADELHIGSEVTIPTAVGTNTLTIDTSLAPSRIEITGHVK